MVAASQTAGIRVPRGCSPNRFTVATRPKAWVDDADRRAAETIAGIVPRPDALAREPRGPYKEIARKIRAAIESGELPEGTELPTVVEMGATHGVSPATAHRAIALLRSEGLVNVSRGRRAVVAESVSPTEEGTEHGD